MGADNWTRCPRCAEPRAFREDYEIWGADEGEVRVFYEGHCTSCGLGTKIDHRKVFWSAEIAATERTQP